MNKTVITILFFLVTLCTYSQTTDLATSVEAQDLNGSDVSQVNIFQEFQYVTTIINSGDSVNNALFSQVLNDQLTVVSITSQNPAGGASDVTDFNVTGSTVSGLIASMPADSSVEVKIVVVAPAQIGGIATTASVFPPNGTTDTNLANNDSVISIDVLDVPVDFTVTHSQITPPENTPISAWGDTVVYEFTITNNSEISFPLNGFSGNLELNSSQNYGQPIVEFEYIDCIDTSNGMECPDLSGIPTITFTLNNNQEVFLFSEQIVFEPNGFITFQMAYKYLDSLCAFDPQPISVRSYIEITANDGDTIDENTSNFVVTDLLTAESCDFTDICIETVQLSPALDTVVDYGDLITFETTVCNNGPLDAPMRFFLQNLTASIQWEIQSLECVGTTGSITCDDFTLSVGDQFWVSSNYVMPADATITVITTLIYLEPECITGEPILETHVRSATNILSPIIFDLDLSNNFDSDFVDVNNSGTECPEANLQVSKTQISPQLPEGSDMDNTTAWGEITYEITITNAGADDVQVALVDLMPPSNIDIATASLVSIDCVNTTGTAACQPVINANFDVEFDGESNQANIPDIFWEITEDENWVLPANSSVTYHVVVDWQPICSFNAISVENTVSVTPIGDFGEAQGNDNTSTSTTYFAPCVDLIVQTFPEFTQVGVNEPFNWIVDISNSSTSSPAFEAIFENLLDPSFTITGTPTCVNTSGNAVCPATFNINGNSIDAVIPSIDVGSTIRIEIPVIAPGTGGAFTNTSEVIPSEINNEELVPETNISISSVQVISPSLSKIFEPDTIFTGQESTLTFTVFNTGSNESQENIAFTDNLPNGVTLSGSPFWSEANGCTGNFIGDAGDDFVGITDLMFPEGVESCSFSVTVTSNTIGLYINEELNFTDQLNIDTSGVFATLNVTEDTTNVDIEVIKTVTPEEVTLGEDVEFSITITNIGTTVATSIEIFDALPSGYSFINASTTLGSYDDITNLWSVQSLFPGEYATLTIAATTISATDLLNIASLVQLNEIDRDDTNNSDSAEVIINNCLEMYQGFSPNGDNLNDVLTIPCIESFPDNNLKIFNRLGVLVFEESNYKNDWDGRANKGLLRTNDLLPVGTYFYILDGTDIPKKRVGWIYLNY
ncbi:gliding motility-associated C-terminal domain-containing protein [Winogradskyella sp. 3972H.M.0a.05]|uniref:DUF7933 domain-containing protein n=1 Tax=Winogradskyella sp. 3972H.M.0a.05 TaxID=2950277 RepID=UPI003395224C